MIEHGGAMDDLFSHAAGGSGSQPIGDGAVLLRGFAVSETESLLAGIAAVAAAAAFRRMVTPGGRAMSVAMTNCGPVGWVSDRTGYRYDPADPETGRPWPTMPAPFRDLAARAAEAAGYWDFAPDACLVNRYAPGTKLSLHQDRDEQDYDAPIVSVSLGLPAVFLFGGPRRNDRPARYRLENGDVVVWGGPTRRVYHGIAPMPDGDHPLTGSYRFNLTFRKAL